MQVYCTMQLEHIVYTNIVYSVKPKRVKCLNEEQKYSF